MKHLLPFNKSIHYLLSAWITVMILLATSSAAAQTVYIGSAQITETLGASPRITPIRNLQEVVC